MPHVGPKDYTACYLREQLKHTHVNRWISTARQIGITFKQKLYVSHSILIFGTSLYMIQLLIYFSFFSGNQILILNVLMDFKRPLND